MKQFYKALFFVIVCCNSLLAFAAETLPPSADISGTATVCQGGASPQITFTGSGGTAPYIFVYKIRFLDVALSSISIKINPVLIVVFTPLVGQKQGLPPLITEN